MRVCGRACTNSAPRGRKALTLYLHIRRPAARGSNSAGREASGEASSKPKGKPHNGAHRELHPNPTRTLDVRAIAAATGVEQNAL